MGHLSTRGLVLTLAIFVILSLLVAVGYTYAKLSASSPRVTRVSPVVTKDISSIINAAQELASGNLLGAAEEIIEGIEVNVEFEIANNGIVPIYVGGIAILEHKLLLNGVEATNPIELAGGWIGPNSELAMSLSATVLLSELSRATAIGLVQGGEIDIQVKSKIGWGFVSRTIRTRVIRYQLAETLESIVRGLLPR